MRRFGQGPDDPVLLLREFDPARLEQVAVEEIGGEPQPLDHVRAGCGGPALAQEGRECEQPVTEGFARPGRSP